MVCLFTMLRHIQTSVGAASPASTDDDFFKRLEEEIDTIIDIQRYLSSLPSWLFSSQQQGYQRPGSEYSR